MVTKLPFCSWPQNIIQSLYCLKNFIFLKLVKYVKSYGHLNVWCWRRCIQIFSTEKTPLKRCFLSLVKKRFHLRMFAKGRSYTHNFFKVQYIIISGEGVTSTHNKRGCAILTKKVAPKIPGTYLELRPKNPGTYLKLRPKNPGTWNATLSSYMRKLTTQIRQFLIPTPRFSFTYFIKGFYYLTFVLWCLCREF